MELCLLVDSTGTPTGRTVLRGTDLLPGEYYPVVHIWIRDENGYFLIQQRAFHLASGPGVWATTVGYVQAGETFVAGAIREVEEELGIRLPLHCLKMFSQRAWENRFEARWLAEVSREAIGHPVLGPEVAAWKWVSKVELGQMVSNGAFFRYSYVDELLA